MTRFVVTGTDTGIGKTVFAAALAGALNARYWKPVQSGLEDETDSEAVARLSGLPAEHILPEAYRLSAPLSPHLSARLAIGPEPSKIDMGVACEEDLAILRETRLKLLQFRN